MYEARPTVTRPGSKLGNFLRDNGVFILLLAAISGLLIADQVGVFDSPHPLVGKPAPGFSLVTPDGRAVSLAEHAGKDVVLLDFFATWCPPCRESLPHMAQMTKDYAGKNVAIYAVNVGESKALVETFLKENKLELNVLIDETGAAAEAYGVGGIPQQVVIGKDGMIRHIGVGFGMGDASKLVAEIDAALAGT